MLQFTDPEKQSTKQGSSQDTWIFLGRGKRIDFANVSRAGGGQEKEGSNWMGEMDGRVLGEMTGSGGILGEWRCGNSAPETP